MSINRIINKYKENVKLIERHYQLKKTKRNENIEHNNKCKSPSHKQNNKKTTNASQNRNVISIACR